MTRNYFKSIYKPWLMACTALCACYPLFYISPTLASFVFWFFLPVKNCSLCCKPYCVQLSTRLPNYFKSLRRMAQGFSSNCLSTVFHQAGPIYFRYGSSSLSGKKESQRIEILKRQQLPANNFGLIFVHFEWIFIYSLLILSEVFLSGFKTRFDESSLDAMVYVSYQ